MFWLTKLILDTYRRDEFIIIIIYGQHGYGKSVLSMKILSEVYASHRKDRFKRVIGVVERNYGEWVFNRYMHWHPRTFIEEMERHDKEVRERGIKEKRPCIVWDDAGYWLNALDWHHPFVKAVSKFHNVIRTYWGAEILTTPVPKNIASKISGTPNVYTVHISKVTGEMPDENPEGRSFQRRVATVYKGWVAPDMVKKGVNKLARDKFLCRLPQDTFEWYNPRRSQYARHAVSQMRDTLKDVQDAPSEWQPETRTE